MDYNKIYYQPDSFTAHYIKDADFLLVISDNMSSATKLRDNLDAVSKKDIYFLPDISGADTITDTNEALSGRLRFLRALRNKEPGIYLTSVSALLLKCPALSDIEHNELHFQNGVKVDYSAVKELLHERGYVRVGIIDSPGTYSFRGDVIDIYPLNYDYPVRILLDDERIEQMYKLDKINLTNAGAIDNLNVDVIAADKMFAESVVSYISAAEPDIFLDDADAVAAALNAGQDKNDADIESREIRASELHLFLKKDEKTALRFSSPRDGTRNIAVRPLPVFHNHVKSFVEYVSALQGKHRIVIFSEDNHYKKRLISVLTDYFNFSNVGIEVKIARFHGGFYYEDERLIILSEDEIYRRIKSRDKRIIPQQKSKRVFQAETIKPGSYVVHINYGIGRFYGLARITADGKTIDLLKIEYANKEYIYLPYYMIDLISLYDGPAFVKPALSNISTGTWAKLKKNAQRSIRDMAARLLFIEGRRKMQPGIMFGPDDAMQAEFESAFEYDETADQLRAAQDIKNLMAEGRHIDFLLCGDSGVGKTEVALRAAAKAVFSGYQVAFIAPTTVLAEQHYENVMYRFSRFPVKIESLIRTGVNKERTRILREAAAGQIDIIVGTHSLLSENLELRRPGLLIIDEEHRFGVEQKEVYKARYKNIGIISLSATPIPRTLYQALSGIKQMSVIKTAPEGRKQVRVILSEFNQIMIRQALKNELARGGQAFYVYNRIKGIPAVEQWLKKLIPSARTDYIHGRMARNEIGEKLYAFSKGQIDILVTTNIVEVGIDFPNMNTMIIEGAENFGFAQLYQLRGRVGRSYKQGAAYMFFERNKKSKPDMRARLRKFAEYTEQGGGLNLALSDMEIRGIGNLLGREQKGHIAKIGFEMYNDMLKQTIAQLQGTEQTLQTEIEINTDVDAFLPDDFVSDIQEKVRFYLKLASCKTIREINDIHGDFFDFYGRLPEEIENLFLIALLKLWAQKYEVSAVRFRSGRLSFKGKSKRILEFIAQTDEQIKVSGSDDKFNVRVARTFEGLKQVVDWLMPA